MVLFYLSIQYYAVLKEIEYHTTFMYIISTLIFAIYLTILEEYFQLCDTRLVELFDGMRPSIWQISEVTTEEHDDSSSSIGLHPVAPLHTSCNANTEAGQLFTFTVFKPSQFNKSLIKRVNSVGTQTCVFDEDMQEFFQKLGRIHATILEAYNIYELYQRVLGFPLLYFTFSYAATILVVTYKITKFGLEDTYSTVRNCMMLIAKLIDFALLTTFPETIDQKVCNATIHSLVEVNH